MEIVVVWWRVRHLPDADGRRRPKRLGQLQRQPISKRTKIKSDEQKLDSLIAKMLVGDWPSGASSRLWHVKVRAAELGVEPLARAHSRLGVLALVVVALDHAGLAAVETTVHRVGHRRACRRVVVTV